MERSWVFGRAGGDRGKDARAPLTGERERGDEDAALDVKGRLNIAKVSLMRH